MNPELYYGLVRYLEEGVIPASLKKKVQQEVKKVHRQFESEKATLYHIGKKGRREVVSEHKKAEVLQEAHDGPLGGHQGQERTLERISRTHYWPTMGEDVRQYVRTCDICQKRVKNKETAPLEPIVRQSRPFYQVGIDVIGPLPRTFSGKRYIIVAVDFFSKWVEARALSEADAQSIAVFLHEDVICRHGVPEILTSDRGTEFVNELITALANTFKIRHIRTTPYHPQANGQTERTNQTLKNLISKLAKDHLGKWDHYLPNALFVARTSVNKSTKHSPAQVIYGRQLRDNLGVPEDPQEHLDNTNQRLRQIREEAHRFISRAQARQKEIFDQRISPIEDFKLGDQVLLYRDLIETSWSAKLEPKWQGPYYVQKIKGTTHYLRNKDGSILRGGVHRNRLKKYQARTNE